MSNIVICCDGTWNTPADTDNGRPIPTNVARLYYAVAPLDNQGSKQHKYYHPGVGTDGAWWEKAFDGGTGRGLDRNIMSAYRELCEHYEDGAKIFLFGFSRGAYTVRSLAGMVSRCGLLNTKNLEEKDAWARIETVFQLGYRRRSEERKHWDARKWKFHNKAANEVTIEFIGVWDTVGALGIPDDMAFLNLLDSLHDFTFHDTSLGTAIKTARHAVALDEMRASFQPTLWENCEGRDVKQVWFPGVHSDVGGGYAETGLSDGALQWMIKEAEGYGLSFSPDMVKQIKPDFQGVAHDSCDGIFTMMPTQPRSAPNLDQPKNVDQSAIDRHANPSILQGPYRPTRALQKGGEIQCDVFANQPWNYTGVWLEAGGKYAFEATGEWVDGSVKCGPFGAADGHFQLGEMANLLGSAWGKVEGLWKKLGKNQAADFRFTKRYEEHPWFCLVGAIANSGGVDGKQHLNPCETFLIGEKRTYSPAASGYFYAFANDAFNCYGNNRGRVRLSIRRL